LFFLALELQSFTFFLFATFNRNSEFSTESGLKYFIYGAVISTLLLVGISVFYSALGSTSFELIFSMFFSIHDPAQILGLFFVLISLFFKIGAAPFHVWLCDVYDGAILTITLLFSSAPKIILFSIFLKFFFFFFFEIKNF
jgi:NADH-quinone oxidoreductase subunit N